MVWEHYEDFSERRIYGEDSRVLLQRLRTKRVGSNIEVTVDSFTTSPPERLIYRLPPTSEYIEITELEATKFKDIKKDESFDSPPELTYIPAFQSFVGVEKGPPFCGPEPPMEVPSACDRPDVIKKHFYSAINEGAACLETIDKDLANRLKQIGLNSKLTLRCLNLPEGSIARVPQKTFDLLGTNYHPSFYFPDLTCSEDGHRMEIYLNHTFLEFYFHDEVSTLFHELMHLVFLHLHDPALGHKERILDPKDQVYGCEQFCFYAGYFEYYEIDKITPSNTPEACARCLGTHEDDPRCTKKPRCEVAYRCTCPEASFKKIEECLTSCRANLGCFNGYGICSRMEMPCETSE